MTKASYGTRRDMCYLIGKRAALLRANAASQAWRSLARQVEALGEKDIPKFMDLLVAIRVSTIMGKRMQFRPLFIALKSEFFEAFRRGEKEDEYRRRGPRWNLVTCRVGRQVILSKGYGKQHRLEGVIVAAHYDTNPAKLPGWTKCYGTNAGDAVVIKIKVQR